jgi:hypothetical protein
MLVAFGELVLEPRSWAQQPLQQPLQQAARPPGSSLRPQSLFGSARSRALYSQKRELYAWNDCVLPKALPKQVTAELTARLDAWAPCQALPQMPRVPGGLGRA